MMLVLEESPGPERGPNSGAAGSGSGLPGWRGKLGGRGHWETQDVS
jgi:hypothetical protein